MAIALANYPAVDGKRPPFLQNHPYKVQELPAAGHLMFLFRMGSYLSFFIH
jgi:hypothetical protein